MKCPFLLLPSVTLNAIGLHIFKQDYPCLISLSRGLLCVALRRWNPSAAFFCERTRAVRSAWDWKVLFLWLAHADTCGRGASKLRAISFPRWSPANLSPSLIGTLHSSLSKEGGLNAAEARLRLSLRQVHPCAVSIWYFMHGLQQQSLSIPPPPPPRILFENTCFEMFWREGVKKSYARLEQRQAEAELSGIGGEWIGGRICTSSRRAYGKRWGGRSSC